VPNVYYSVLANARSSDDDCLADFDLTSSIDHDIMNIQRTVHDMERLVNVLKTLKNLNPADQVLTKASCCGQLHLCANSGDMEIG